MNRGDLLRAHTYRAHALRGTEAFAQAVRDVVDGWVMFPAIAAAYALECARAEEAAAVHIEAAWCEDVVDAALRRVRGPHPGRHDMGAWIRDSAALMRRSTYPQDEVLAA